MKKNKTEIEQAIGLALDRIEKGQLESGGFLSCSSPDQDNFNNAKQYRTTFITSQVLCCLNTVSEGRKYVSKDISILKDKASKFLALQRSEFWSLNYWDRSAPEHSLMPYPDDLDDTFCALSALYGNQPQLFTGDVLARIITLLTSAEEREGGPYRTWLAKEDSSGQWQDIDLAVNANIASFLNLHDIELENLNRLIEDAIRQADYTSSYYPKPFPVIYFISRAYKGALKDCMMNFLSGLREPDLSWGNLLDTALAVCSLLNMGHDPLDLAPSIRSMLSKINIDGFQALVFCIDPAISGQTFYAGAPSLTAAYCLEALSGYSALIERTQNGKGINGLETDTQIEMYKKFIRQEMDLRFKDLGDDLRELAGGYLNEYIDKDIRGERTLFPYFFSRSLALSDEISREFITRLCLANIYGWAAYTVYDDFLDDEGETSLLPAANFFLRELASSYAGLLPETAGFRSVFRKIMDMIDTANAWEIKNCRTTQKNGVIRIPSELPDYQGLEKLYERSFGHALGPLAIMCSLGSLPGTPDFEALSDFFKHYLSARQLNDDMHDWEEDLRKGQLNYIGTGILRKYSVLYPEKKQLEEIDFPELRKVFWHQLAGSNCLRVKEEVAMARKLLKNMEMIAHQDVLEKFIDRLEAAAEQALREREDAIMFIKTLQGYK